MRRACVKHLTCPLMAFLALHRGVLALQGKSGLGVINFKALGKFPGIVTIRTGSLGEFFVELPFVWISVTVDTE